MGMEMTFHITARAADKFNILTNLIFSNIATYLIEKSTCYFSKINLYQPH